MTQKACILLAVWLCPLLAAAEPTASERRLELRLRQPVSVTWQGQQLGEALRRLAAAQQIAVWLDRRVDPQQPVEMQLRGLSLWQALEKLAKQHKLGVSRLGPMVYVGPPQSALELATLRRQARSTLARTPSAVRRRWLQKEPSDWPQLSEPRALLTDLLTSAGIGLQGDEKVPHDLWGRHELPAMALIDRVVLILVGFDLTCRVSDNGRSCTVVPIERPLAIENASPVAIPVPRIRRSQRAKQVFSLKLNDQPLGKVIDQLAQQLQLEVRWDKELLAKRRSLRARLVSCDVQNVDLDELLASVLEPAGLYCQREGQGITIEEVKMNNVTKKRSSP
ncbi:MAG: hypothetical protein MI725_10705 [Pirellulales bacterium]|nr:hypothetical protein [Pirellulales bacterium]